MTANKKEILKSELYAIAKKNGTEPFVKSDVPNGAAKLYKTATFFANAVFRGTKLDAFGALELLYPDKILHDDYRGIIAEGFVQFRCDSGSFPQIIEKFPNLKAICFAEDWHNGVVYFAYSESGYPTFTDIRMIGKCDFFHRDRWTLLHDPAEASFKEDEIEYTFSEREKWEKCDFVLPDGKEKLAGSITAASLPYPQRGRTDRPLKIVKGLPLKKQ